VGLHFAKKRQQNKCTMGWVCIVCKKAKMKPQMQEPRFKRLWNILWYQNETSARRRWYTHVVITFKSQNTKWIVPSLCFHKNCTHKWTPPYVGIVKQWVGFFKKEKKGRKKRTPSPQGMYIDSLSCLPIPPLQVLKVSLKPPLKP